MELFLFYEYLEHLKKQRKSLMRRMLRLPVVAIILVTASIISFVLCVIFAFYQALHLWSVVSLISETVCCVILYWYTEHYQIMRSKVRYKEYIDYCNNIYDFLAENSISNKEFIQDIRTRILDHAQKLEDNMNQSRARLDRWMQILLIPVMLAIFSHLTKEQTDIQIVMSYAVSIIFAVIFIYTAIYLINNIIRVFKKRRMEQFYSFANDLQGVIDTRLGLE